MGYWIREILYEEEAWGCGIEAGTNIFVYMPQGIEPRRDGKVFVNYKDTEVELTDGQRDVILRELRQLSQNRYHGTPAVDAVIADIKRMRPNRRKSLSGLRRAQIRHMYVRPSGKNQGVAHIRGDSDR